MSSFSTYVHTKQEALLKHVVRAPNQDPLRETMLHASSLLPVVTNNRRVGRPKSLWAHEVYKRIWIKAEMGSETQFESNRDVCIEQMAAPIKARIV